MRDQNKERRGLRAFGHKQDGVMAVIMVICLPLIIGVCALVIDLGYAWMTRNQLQATADASSLAAASKLGEISPSDTSVAVAEANALAEANMPTARHGDVLLDADIEFGFFNPISWTFLSGTTPYNAVRTTTRRAAANNNPLDAIFAVIFGRDAFDVNTSAVAVDGKFDDFLSCMHALNKTADDSLYVFGNATINAQGCNIQVDSDSPDAFTAQGNPLIINSTDDDEPGAINIYGGYNQVGGSVDLQPSSDIIYENSDHVQKDPWGDIVEWGDDMSPAATGDQTVELPQPSTNTADCANGTGNTTINVSGTVTFPPDTYTTTATEGTPPGPYGDVWQFCGNLKFTGNGTVEFKQGTYIFQGDFDTVGSVGLSGQTDSVTGNVVGWNTFILDGPDARVDMGGTSDINFRAPGFTPNSQAVHPETGEFVYDTTKQLELAGFLWIGDPDGPSSSDCMLMKGTSGSAAVGINYFPNDCIEFKGTADSGMAEANCSVYIADTFYFNGDVALDINAECSGLAGSDGTNALNVPLRLVM